VPFAGDGKRALITAETGRALNVLKEKLPEDIQPLCVSLLGRGGDAFAELNAAVQSITTRFGAALVALPGAARRGFPCRHPRSDRCHALRRRCAESAG